MEWCKYPAIPETRVERMARIRREKFHYNALCFSCLALMYIVFIALLILWFECII